MDVASKPDSGPNDISASRRELEKAFAPLTQAGIELDIRDGSNGAGYTASQMSSLADIYSTPDAQRQLKQIADETVRSDQLMGAKSQSSISLSPIEGEANDALATNYSTLNNDGSTSISLKWNTSDLDAYKADVDDGRYDATGPSMDPLQTRDNEGDEILARMKITNDLVEKGADPNTAVGAANNLVSSAQFQLSTFGLNHGTADVLNRYTNENPRVAVPADESKREQFTKDIVGQISPEQLTDSMNKGVNLGGAYYANPTIWTQDDASQVNMTGGDMPDFTEQNLDPSFNNSVSAGPGIVKFENGVLLPDDADKRIENFVNQQLQEDLPSFSGRVGVRLEDSEFRLGYGEESEVERANVEKPVFYPK